jgi:hypothetical protein
MDLVVNFLEKYENWLNKNEMFNSNNFVLAMFVLQKNEFNWAEWIK